MDIESGQFGNHRVESHRFRAFAVNWFVGAGLNTPGAIAIDPSGDLWVSNTSIFSPSTDEIAEFVGIAGPVMTPQIGPPTVP